MNKISTAQIKKYLKNCPRERLIDDLSDLLKKFGSVRDYYQTKLSPENGEQVIEKYKAIIEKEFFPKYGFGEGRLSVARKAVTEYKKVSANIWSLIDLMLYYVETGVRYTRA